MGNEEDIMESGGENEDWKGGMTRIDQDGIENLRHDKEKV